MRDLLHIPGVPDVASSPWETIDTLTDAGNVLKEPLFSSPDFNRYRSNNKECCVGSFERSILALFAAGPERPAVNIVSDWNTKPSVKLRLPTSRLPGQLRPRPDAEQKQTRTKTKKKKELGATGCITGGGEDPR